MAEKLVAIKGFKNMGWIIETESGEAVALTYKNGVAGKKWANRIVSACNKVNEK